jgi:hypothetical protein
MAHERAVSRRKRPTAAAHFTEVQRVEQPLVFILLGASALVGAAVVLGVCLRADAPLLHTVLTTGAVLAPFPIIIAALRAASMATEVRDDGLWIRMAFVPWWRQFDLDDLAEHRAETYHPITEFGGWGYKRARGGKRAYSFTGNRGVRLIFTDGKQVMVGSRKADALDAAVTALFQRRRARRP